MGGLARVALVIGLGSLFSSMLIYSGVAISFLRFEPAVVFMGTFAEALLLSATLISAFLVGISLAGNRIPFLALAACGSVGYVCCALSFAFMAQMGSPGDGVVMILAAITALSNCCLCLAWGRLCARLRIRQALVVVSFASLYSAALCMLYSIAPPWLFVGLFAFASIVAVVVPLALAGVVAPTVAASPMPRKLHTTIASMLDVAAAPGLGLIVFAFVMATMRAQFGGSQAMYFAMLSLDACAIVLFVALRKKKVSLHNGMNQTLLPLLALVLLATTGITASLGTGEQIASAVTYALYGLAAILALSTLCAIANAGEFSPDLVFSIAMFLFAGTSLCGQLCASVMDESFVPIAVTIATTLYAFVMVLSSHVRHRRTTDAPETGEASEGSPADAMASRCSKLADAYGLTAREREILRHLAEGHSGAYIADVLFISPNTARTHIHNIYRKLDVSSREDVLRLTKEPPEEQRGQGN